jgi:hypothetical protein
MLPVSEHLTSLLGVDPFSDAAAGASGLWRNELRICLTFPEAVIDSFRTVDFHEGQYDILNSRVYEDLLPLFVNSIQMLYR